MEEEENWFKRVKLNSALYKNLKSLQRKDRTTYGESVLKMYHDYEEMVFNLSEQSKSENIESIKRMSLGQRLKFQQLITKRNMKINSARGKDV